MKQVLLFVAIIAGFISCNNLKQKNDCSELRWSTIIIDDDTLNIQSFGPISAFPSSIDSNMILSMNKRGDTCWILHEEYKIRLIQSIINAQSIPIKVIDDTTTINIKDLNGDIIINQ